MNGSDILASFPSSKQFHGQNVANAMESLANADAVCFDVDSTVIAEEGIDVLADYLGKGEQVAELTRKAMEGSTKFQDALKARLDLLQPSKQSILDCLESTPFQLTPGVDSFIETLIEANIDVYLVSGGFRIMIEPIARQVCVAKTNIYANTILFDEDGNYTGFDHLEPTSADMGKPKALERIKKEGGYNTMVMIGDGATDAQAKPPADAFIGFGGIVVRQAVKEKACWFVTDFQDLQNVVEQFGTNKGKE
jgi:phosphoserine phosphatase